MPHLWKSFRKQLHHLMIPLPPKWNQRRLIWIHRFAQSRKTTQQSKHVVTKINNHSELYLADIIEMTQKNYHLRMKSNSWYLDLICWAYLQLVDHVINSALARLLNRLKLSSALGKVAVTVAMYGHGTANHLSRTNQLETSCCLQLSC